VSAPELRTERLVLRQWRDEDLPHYAALNADLRVMEFFPAPWTAEQSALHAQRQRDLLDAGAPGLFALERREHGDFIGFVGLAVPAFEAPFTPCVEIGWRLAADVWRQGYATEAAFAVLDDGFSRLGLSEIVSFTARINTPSRAVMRRIGMTHDPDEDFEHPSLAPGDPLRAHVLCRIRSGDHHHRSIPGGSG
jgi:RimJ/RimL family protein N-acetyltransferase